MGYKTTWYEVEHSGDTERYCAAIRRAGGNPVAVQLDPVEEEAIIVIDSEDNEAVLRRLEDDPDGEFCYQVFHRKQVAAYRRETAGA